MLEIENPCFKNLTTIHLGGTALSLLKPECAEDFSDLAPAAKKYGGNLLPIGRGSNLLAREGSLPLVLVSMEKFDKIRINGKKDDALIIEAEAGVPLPRLLRFCLQNGLSGLEGLVGIPGNVGGACAMNAGSFGTTIGDYIYACEIWNGESQELIDRNGIEFTYRKTRFKNIQVNPIITKVFFTLTEADKSVIFACMNLNFLNKKSRQPISAWSAGCAFKNPENAPSAGKLLDECGFRGFAQGGMIFSPKHANFLVNTGTGTAAEAFFLLETAIQKVEKSTGIRLEPEIRILPCPLP